MFIIRIVKFRMFLQTANYTFTGRQIKLFVFFMNSIQLSIKNNLFVAKILYKRIIFDINRVRTTDFIQNYRTRI
jgi:hypothetical protein